MSNRIDKVNELLQQQISQIIIKEVSLKPTVFVTIAKVDVSRDLRYAQVLISVFPEGEEEYVLRTLEKESWRLQNSLYKKLVLKPFPKIRFLIDKTEQHADKIEHLLAQIHEEEK